MLVRAPPRTCVSDEAPCANTGPTSKADMATAIAEVFTSFIHFSQDWLATNNSATRAPFLAEHAHRRIRRVTNGAPAMQAARCGDRAGISGSFCESLATDRPHMRRVEPRVQPFTNVPFDRLSGAAAGPRPLLFCRETARYYHHLFSATYSLRTPTVKHMTKLRTIWALGPGFCAALLVVTMAGAQMPLPAAKPPDGPTLFKQ